MDNFKINDLPLSERAKKQIHRYISGMDLQESNKLPREEQLAEIIGVSRITIRKALNDLAFEGIVFRRQGRGTFVNVDSLNIKVKFHPAMEFTRMIRDSGYEPSVRLLDIRLVPWDEEIGGMLQLERQEHLVMTAKIFLADNKLCSYCIDYFALGLIGGIEGFERFSSYQYSVFDYIYNLSGEKIEWDKVEISSVLGQDIPYFDKYMDMECYGPRPYLLVKGIDYNIDNKPLLVVEEYINTDIIKFSMIRQRMIRYSN